jgi:hypothetical protein
MTTASAAAHYAKRVGRVHKIGDRQIVLVRDRGSVQLLLGYGCQFRTGGYDGYLRDPRDPRSREWELVLPR